jgi:hypothetical protein
MSLLPFFFSFGVVSSLWGWNCGVEKSCMVADGGLLQPCEPSRFLRRFRHCRYPYVPFATTFDGPVGRTDVGRMSNLEQGPYSTLRWQRRDSNRKPLENSISRIRVKIPTKFDWASLSLGKLMWGKRKSGTHLASLIRQHGS